MLKGCITALVTPFKDGKVDYDSLKRVLEFQINQGVKSFIINGTTAEASTMTLEEKREVLSYVIDNTPEGTTIGAGVSSNDTSKMVKEIMNVEDLSFEYLLITSPYYNKTSQKGLIAHINEAINNTDKKIILYNIPGRTGMSFSIDTIEELSKNKQIVAVKEASGNVAYAQQLFLRLGDKLDILSGNDDLSYLFAALGSPGTISATGNLIGGKFNEMYQHIDNNDWTEAKRVYEETLTFSFRVFDDINPILVKALLSRLGLLTNELRLPLISEDGNIVDELLKEYYKVVK